MQYTETFSTVKDENFIGRILIFFILLLKTLIVSLGEAVLTSIHNMCFGLKISNIGIPL